jgi:hypothetical protein
MPKYRWTESYDYKNDQPYGLKLVFDVLSNSYPKDNFVFIDKSPKVMLQKEDTSSLYVFIGENFICDSLSSIELANFVKRGNNAFFSNIEGEHLLNRILTNGNYPYIELNYLSDSIITVDFDTIYHQKPYKFDHRFGKKLTEYKWTGFDIEFLQDTLSAYGFEAITTIDSTLADCVRIKYGKGWFIFHSNPLFFTNYSMTKENGYKYLNALLSDYKKTRLLWDEYSKSAMTDSSFSSSQESPLRFILSEKSLRWSWYLICFFILIFVLFNSKRKQAQIPLIPSNNNTSVEFVNSIALLYFRNNSDKFIAEEMMKQFLSFVKHKYGISPNVNKKDIPSILAPLSKVPEKKLDELFVLYADVVYSNENENNKELIKFYQSVEYFYKNCK